MDARLLPTTSSLDPNALGALRGQARAEDPKALEVAARQFESLFLNQLLKSMREAQVGGGEEDSLFDSHEQRTFTSLLDEQMANRIANGRGIGLADMLIAQINRAKAMLANPADPAAQSAAPAAADAIKNPHSAPITKAGA